MKNLIIALVLFLSMSSSVKAHISYNPSADIDRQLELLSFWNNKALQDPFVDDYKIKQSIVNTTLFQLTGSAQYLLAAQENLNFTSNTKSLSRSTGLCLLAQNLITQHKFCEAYDAVLAAAEIGRNKKSISLILFDVEYELGYDTEKSLAAIPDKTSMDYSIRKAKQYKKEGNYEEAIYLMEQCYDQALLSKKQDLAYWLKSNIAELYIENDDNRMAKKILKKLNRGNKSEWYTYKLLAKVEYQENNKSSALDIVKHVLEYRESPELSILKHRIEKELDGKETYEINDDLHDLMHDPEKGSMYATHVAKELLHGDQDERALALSIAEHEVQHRDTPETQALLAYAYYKNNKLEKSRAIINDKLKGQNLKKESQEYIDEIEGLNDFSSLLTVRGFR